jgi:hypothetical protein
MPAQGLIAAVTRQAGQDKTNLIHRFSRFSQIGETASRSNLRKSAKSVDGFDGNISSQMASKSRGTQDLLLAFLN